MSYFIALEGCEGSGKSTVAHLLEHRLDNVVISREPGGIPVSEDIRNIIMDYDVDKKTELLLYLCARREHLLSKIVPALSSGKTVICDRFYLSTLAYQGYADGLGIDHVRRLNDFMCNIFPTFSIFIDLPPEIGLSRKTDGTNKIDLRGLEYHQRVYEGYQKLIRLSADDIEVVDGSLSIDNVLDSVCNIIDRRCR